MDNNDELAKLKDKIIKLKKENSFKPSTSNKIDPSTIGIELVAGVLAGLILGVLLDKMFTTKPLFLIICLVLGIIASLRTIYKKR